MAFSWCTRPSSACKKYVPSGNLCAWADRTEHFAQRVGLSPRPYCDVSGTISIPNSTLYSTPVACAGTSRPLPFTFSLIIWFDAGNNRRLLDLPGHSTSKSTNFQGLNAQVFRSLTQCKRTTYFFEPIAGRTFPRQLEESNSFPAFSTLKDLILQDMQVFQSF